jgi:hypothetical protein
MARKEGNLEREEILEYHSTSFSNRMMVMIRHA